MEIYTDDNQYTPVSPVAHSRRPPRPNELSTRHSLFPILFLVIPSFFTVFLCMYRMKIAFLLARRASGIFSGPYVHGRTMLIAATE